MSATERPITAPDDARLAWSDAPTKAAYYAHRDGDCPGCGICDERREQ
jgi:hypothetical protein